MKLYLLLGIFAALVILGCTQPVSDTLPESEEVPAPVADDITGEVLSPSAPAEPELFVHGLPCTPSRYGTLETMGPEIRVFLGKTYEFCHTQSQVPNPPEGGTGTPDFIRENVWAYMDVEQTGDIISITYTIAEYTDGYYQGGVTYLTQNGQTCFSATYGPQPQELGDYVESDFTCG